MSASSLDFDVFTVPEAAKRSRISERWLWALLKAGTGPVPTRIGDRVLIRSDMLAAWLVSRTVQQQDRAAA